MISIIVPVYNTVIVLPTCLQSILVQTYQDFEILLIDDGSQDGSASVCDFYASQDVRIRVFHKLNEGVSSARNLGLDNARGEYITYIDSDDAVEPDYLEQLLKDFTEDLVICGFKSTEGSVFIPESVVITEDRMAMEVPIMLENPFLLYTCWGKIFHRKLIEQHQLRFDVRLHLYEDTIFVLTYLTLCRSVRKQSFSGYLYTGTWGGTKKYILSLDDVKYRCKTEMLILQQLEHAFSCCINKSTRAYCVEYLDNLYGKYTDKFCIEMYLNYHPEATKQEFLNNLYFYPSYALISYLKRLYQQKSKVEGQILIKKLNFFFTVSIDELHFRRKDEKLLYSLICSKHLRLVDFILRIYSVIKW